MLFLVRILKIKNCHNNATFSKIFKIYLSKINYDIMLLL